jgi:type IV pilus biogenesis protein CpaD/CtpE
MPLNPLARLALLGPAVAALLAGCATNPVTGTPDLVFQSEAG